MKVIKSWLLALCVGLVSACGGGGASSSGAIQSAEGLWQGNTSDGYNVTAAVLENGELWALVSSSSGVVGFMNGVTSVAGYAVTGNETSYNLVNNTYFGQTFSGSVTSKSSLALSSSSGSFNATYQSGYDQAPAGLAAMAGTYSGWLASVSGTFSPSSVVTISSTGQISSPGAPCSANGSITPRASGKNVYNVTIGFAGALCSASATTLSGIAVYSDSSGVLVVLALNSSKSDGLVYSATKQTNVATTFPLRAGYQAFLTQALTSNYAISGTCTGTATESRTAATAATFEGVAGYTTTTTLTGSYSNCTPATFAGTSSSYYDSNYKPTGTSITGTEYGVFTSAIDMPTTVSVGDTAQFGTVDVYSSNTKLTKTGMRVLSYVVEPGATSNDAVVNLIARAYNLSNQLLFTQQSRFRLTSSGGLTPVSVDIQYSTTSSTHLVWTKI